MAEIMRNITVYLTQMCPYCIRARGLLDRKGVDYEIIDLGAAPDLWGEMRERSRRDTVPQIFIGEHHVGGYDDMAALDRQGELDKLLGLDA